MKEQKKYHQRKLAIIDFIDLCDEVIKHEKAFLQRIINDYLPDTKNNVQKNIERYEKIKNYLITRYHR